MSRNRRRSDVRSSSSFRYQSAPRIDPHGSFCGQPGRRGGHEREGRRDQQVGQRIYARDVEQQRLEEAHEPQ